MEIPKEGYSKITKILRGKNRDPLEKPIKPKP